MKRVKMYVKIKTFGFVIMLFEDAKILEFNFI